MDDGGADLGKASRRANISTTHRTLYRLLMLFSVWRVALAFNFFLTTPTFNPYDIPKNLIGAIFLATGAAQIVFLNVVRNLKLVRLTTAATAGFVLFWGVATAQPSFSGKASFQLPIMFVGWSIAHFFLLVEPAVNPVSHPSGDS